jgi:hypothetical protein
MRKEAAKAWGCTRIVLELICTALYSVLGGFSPHKPKVGGSNRPATKFFAIPFYNSLGFLKFRPPGTTNRSCATLLRTRAYRIWMTLNRVGCGAMQLGGRDENKLVWRPPRDVDTGFALLRTAVASDVNHRYSPFLWSPRQNEDTALVGTVNISTSSHRGAAKTLSLPEQAGAGPGYTANFELHPRVAVIYQASPPNIPTALTAARPKGINAIPESTSSSQFQRFPNTKAEPMPSISALWSF